MSASSDNGTDMATTYRCHRGHMARYSEPRIVILVYVGSLLRKSMTFCATHWNAGEAFVNQ